MTNNKLFTRHSTDVLLTRRATLSPSTFSREQRTVEATLVSASNAVQRRDSSGRQFNERLSTAAGAFSLHTTRLPVLDGHRTGSIADILGYVENVRSEADEVRATLHITNDPALALIEAGALSGVSIGYRVAEWRDGHGERTATRYTIHETSLTPSPADPAALLRSDSMPDPQPNTVAETNRTIRNLTSAAGLPITFADSLIDRAASVEQARTALFDEMTRRSHPLPRAYQIGVSGDDPSVICTRAADALAHRLGAPGTLPDDAREFANDGLHMTLRKLLSLRGEAGAFTMNVTDLITRALTTSDLPALLTDTTNRLLLPAYTAAQSPVRQILARQSTAADFRDLHRVRISESPLLEKVEEHGEITQGGFTESDESYRIATYARIVSITLAALTNDDLGAFGRTAAAMGEAAAQTENNLLIALLTANAGAGPVMSDGFNLFNAANHHNASASGAAIDATTISAGVLAMRSQKGLDGQTPINVVPRYLLVPASKEFIARQQIATVYPATAADANPLQGTLEPLVEPRLSGTRWYLWADPANAPVLEYAYLNGREGPQVDSRQGWEVLGVELRVVDHFGAGVISYVGAYTNVGA